MNSESTTSPTTAAKATSEPPSSTQESSSEEFLTEPLVGLCPKPVDQMTETELRAFVVAQQALRTSHQTFRARMESRQQKDERVLSEFEPAKKKSVLGEFEV